MIDLLLVWKGTIAFLIIAAITEALMVSAICVSSCTIPSSGTIIYRRQALAQALADAEWIGTATTMADGSVEPETAPISSTDNITYVLDENICGSVVVHRNNLVLDGGRHQLEGNETGVDRSTPQATPYGIATSTYQQIPTLDGWQWTVKRPQGPL